MFILSTIQLLILFSPPHTHTGFVLSSHLQSAVKAEEIQPLSLMQHKRRKNVDHMPGACGTSSPQICGSHQAQKGCVFPPKLLLVKKKGGRGRAKMAARPSCQVETELQCFWGCGLVTHVSILLWELSSPRKVARVVTRFTSIFGGDVDSASGEFIFVLTSLSSSWCCS